VVAKPDGKKKHVLRLHPVKRTVSMKARAKWAHCVGTRSRQGKRKKERGGRGWGKNEVQKNSGGGGKLKGTSSEHVKTNKHSRRKLNQDGEKTTRKKETSHKRSTEKRQVPETEKNAKEKTARKNRAST